MLAEMVRDTIRQGSVYLIGQLSILITNLVTLIVFSRIFIPAEYGLLTLALLMVSVLTITIDNWLTSAATRFLPHYKREKKLDVYYSTLVLCILSVVIVYLSMWIPVYLAFGNYLSSAFRGLLLPIISLVPLNMGFDVLLVNFRIRLEAKRYASIQIGRTILGLLVGLLLVIHFDFGVDGILWGQILVVFILDTVFFAVSFSSGSHVGLTGVSSSALKKFLVFGLPLTFANIGSWILTGADRYVIGFFWTQNEVGMYSASWSIANMVISVIVSPLSLVVGPYMINVWESRNRGLAEKLLSQLTRLSILITLPMVVGVSILATVLVQLLTTPPYYPGASAIPFVALGAFVYGLSLLSYMGLGLANRSDLIAVNYMLAGGLSVVLNILLVPLLGFMASAIVYFISCTFLLVMNAALSNRYLKWIVIRSSVINATIASIIMGGITIYMTPIFPGLLTQCVIAVLVGIAVYVATLLILGEFTRQEMSEIKKLIK